ncbi:MAG TPA: WGR domain-containing protein, partial [Myxococcota bacterium]
MSNKRMFEFVEGSASKFWEIWRDGSEVRTRYGKIGTAGQTTVKDEGTDAAGQKLYDKLVREKTGKGYVEKTAGGAAPAPVPAAPAPAPVAKPAPAKAAPKKAAVVEDDDEDGDADDDVDDGGSEGEARYEVDGKFWAISLDGSSHTVRFGKIGTAGTSKTKDFDDDAAAKKDHDKLVKEKTGKGYALVSGAAAPASAAT